MSLKSFLSATKYDIYQSEKPKPSRKFIRNCSENEALITCEKFLLTADKG
jgi:hypothetical protein